MTVVSLRCHHRGVLLLIAAFGLLAGAGCSDDDGDGADDGAGATGAGGAGGGGGSGGAPVQPFNGDCSSAKWADVSDECWSCMCTACRATLDVCDETCVDVMACSFESGCMVNRGNEISCEIRCVTQTCMTDPAAQAAARAVIDFDTCLITATKPSGFRVCEDVCAIPYPGDVCTRYP